jgi:uncharacterized protein YcfJ
VKRLSGALGFLILLSGCATPLTTREKGVLAGGALGAGAGALIGNQFERPGRGAAIGGAIGALGGGLIGDQMEGQNQRQNAQAYEAEQNRRELERQRRELDNLRRSQDGSSDRGYDRSGDPYYDRYNRSSDRDYDYDRGGTY